MNRQPQVDPRVEAMGMHSCQRLAYDWILRKIEERGGVKGKRVLDFGPGGYPFAALLATLGGRVFWVDRDPRVTAKMAKQAVKHGVSLTRIELDEARDMNIIIASNAIQHNLDPEPLYAALRDALAPRGSLYVVEAIAPSVSHWDDHRADPCLYRTLPDIVRAWGRASLACDEEAFIAYTFNADRAQETASWTMPAHADRVVARLEAAE